MLKALDRLFLQGKQVNALFRVIMIADIPWILVQCSELLPSYGLSILTKSIFWISYEKKELWKLSQMPKWLSCTLSREIGCLLPIVWNEQKSFDLKFKQVQCHEGMVLHN